MMHAEDIKRTLSTIIALSGTLLSLPSNAYIGPGAGIGMIGSLIAVVVVVLVIVLGLVIYPIRMMRKKRRQEAEKAQTSES
jgi:uncharacterized membrane protein